MNREDAEPLTVQAVIDAFEPRVAAVAGLRGLSRVVEGVSVGEEGDSVCWMAPRSLVLSSGIMVQNNPNGGERLIKQFNDAGMSAIGCSLVPQWPGWASMIAAGDKLSFPVLRLSGGMPFHEIMSHVFGALSSTRVAMLQRSVAVQRALAEVLAKGRGPDGLVGKLSELLRADVFLFDWHGGLSSHVFFSTTKLTPDVCARLWSLYGSTRSAATGPPAPQFNDCEVHFREVRVGEGIEQALIAVLPAGKTLDLFTERTLSFASVLLASAALANRNALGDERRAREALLAELLQRHGQPVEQSERLARYGIVSRDPWRLLELAVDPHEPHHERRQSKVEEPLMTQGAEVVNRYLESVGAPFIMAPQPGCLVIMLSLVSHDQLLDARQFARDLVAHVARVLRLPGLRAGLSEPFARAADVPEAFTHAYQALMSTSIGIHGPSSAVLYEDLGTHFAALNALPEEYLQRLRARVVAPLLEFDHCGRTHLHDTLRSYLAHNGSLADTSKALYLHRNTLSRRLENIEKILQVDLRNVSNLVEVYLAVRATDLLALRERLTR